jgi:hypothetical protein
MSKNTLNLLVQYITEREAEERNILLASIEPIYEKYKKDTDELFEFLQQPDVMRSMEIYEAAEHNSSAAKRFAKLINFTLIPAWNIEDFIDKWNNLCLVPIEKSNSHNYNLGIPALQIRRGSTVFLRPEQGPGNSFEPKTKHIKKPTDAQIRTAIEQAISGGWVKSVGLGEVKIDTEEIERQFQIKLARIMPALANIILARTALMDYSVPEIEEIELSELGSKIQHYLTEERTFSGIQRESLGQLFSAIYGEKISINVEVPDEREVRYVKGAMIVPVGNRGGHGYPLNVPMFYSGAFRAETNVFVDHEFNRGNRMDFFLSSSRPANKEEVMRFLGKLTRENLLKLHKVLSTLETDKSPLA